MDLKHQLAALQPKTLPIVHVHRCTSRVLPPSPACERQTCLPAIRELHIARALPGDILPKPGKKVELSVPEIKEAHKVFDEVFIVVKSGDGGQGEVVQSGAGRWVPNLKYKPGGSQAKTIWLPASEPSDGCDGADVILQCDPSYDNLLHLHTRKQFTAPRGANGNPAAGSGGPKNNRNIKKATTPAFIIPVPPGTVVKRKSSGLVLGELINPGDKLVVARGGRGGTGAVAPSRVQKRENLDRQRRRAAENDTELVEVEDTNWKADAAGAAGQQLSLHLLLRVVADVGIVGFPNAGKSSLLKGLTRAAPEVAPYPFTTLMPNLGVLASGGPHKTVLADLPGLIEGAHEGKGLGRMFLRHLRRTRALLHVVDGSAPDPATDYYAVREELRMYNPEYVTRPHVVVLNKMDLPEAAEQRDAVVSALLDAAARHCEEWSSEEQKPTAPVAVVTASAATGEGLGELNKALAAALKPQTLKDLKQRGTAATRVVISASEATAGALVSGSSQPQADAQTAVEHSSSSSSSRSEAAGNPQAGIWGTGADAQQGAASRSGAAGGEDDEGADSKGPLDPEDEWLFSLTDNQLFKIMDQDEAKFQSREAAAAAKGINPYAASEQEADAAQAAKAAAVSQAAAAASAAGGAKAGAASSSKAMLEDEGTGSSAEGGEEVDEGEDEWVELTEEEIELLKFMDEYEAEQAAEAEAQAAAEAGAQAATAPQKTRSPKRKDKDALSAAGADEEDAPGPVAEEDQWLFTLSEEELLKLADKAE